MLFILLTLTHLFLSLSSPLISIASIHLPKFITIKTFSPMIGSPAPPSSRDDRGGNADASFFLSAADMKTKPSRMPIGSVGTKTTLQKKKNHGNTKYTSNLMRYRILLNVMILLAYLGCTASVVLEGDSTMQVCNLCHLIRICMSMSTNHYRPTISIPFI